VLGGGPRAGRAPDLPGKPPPARARELPDRGHPDAAGFALLAGHLHVGPVHRAPPGRRALRGQQLQPPGLQPGLDGADAPVARRPGDAGAVGHGGRLSAGFGPASLPARLWARVQTPPRPQAGPGPHGAFCLHHLHPAGLEPGAGQHPDLLPAGHRDRLLQRGAGLPHRFGSAGRFPGDGGLSPPLRAVRPRGHPLASTVSSGG